MLNNIKGIHEKFVNVMQKLVWAPPLVFRLVLGFIFVQAGWGKLQRLEQVIGYFESLGIPAASIQAPFVAGLEFLGGLLLISGLLTRYTSLLLMGVMAVAIMTAHGDKIEGMHSLFSMSEFLYVLIFGYLVVAGSGSISADLWLAKKKS